ncbi:hypothetical protein BDY21DRAFT_135693 [Lineolata rhizophorae]|uniref:RNA polymerase II assembly factor Rtp1 C-terminal domain-containing protein n=1 Tax=Lineolata rhizophorae TaxID=578093 RepID=A0A6A6PAG4_9PEZI|nr:hypothetical protein BDY21DRAFT_135693 [Lineolata rhizophorae]
MGDEFATRRRNNQALEYDNLSTITVYALLDVLSYVGIQPFLSSGVRPVRRPRPVIKTDALKATFNSPYGMKVAENLVMALSTLLRDVLEGIQGHVQDRIYLDLICGAAELAFSPQYEGETSLTFRRIFDDIAESTTTSNLLLTLTCLLRPDTPPWLRPELGNRLTLISLRPHGVRHIIDFVSTPHARLLDGQQQKPSEGPAVTLEALGQVSQILSSPPSMPSQEYFTRLAPQLLQMLDGADGQELVKAAAFIIGKGILGKRSLGAPGATGWEIFATPMLTSIGPDARQQHGNETIVTEIKLRQALRRMNALIISHPNPGLTKRLVGSILLPLWGLLLYSNGKGLDQFWTNSAKYLLETYVKLSAGLPQLQLLADNIIWDGPLEWTYGRGTEGGIELRGRQDRTGMPIGIDIMDKVTQVDLSIATYLSLLSAGNVDNVTLGSLFVAGTKKWLIQDKSSDRTYNASLLSPDERHDPLETLIVAKFVQGMLDKFKSQIVAQPINIIGLINQILEHHIEEASQRHSRQSKNNRQGGPTYAGLSEIVHGNATRCQQELESEAATAEEEGDDLAIIALSLLNAVITASSFQRTPEVTALLNGTVSVLEHISTTSASASSPSLISAAADLKALITSPPTSTRPKPPLAAAVDLTTTTAGDELTAALTTIQTPSIAPALRGAALRTIESLVRSPSSGPVIDVPGTTLLFLRAALPDRDPFVYTAAIRALVALGAAVGVDAGGFVARRVLDAFVDPAEESVGDARGGRGEESEETAGLDGRLRAGEVLGGIVEEVTAGSGPAARASGVGMPASFVATVQRIASACLLVASRRGQRKKTLAVRQKHARRAAQKQKDLRTAWGDIEPPSDPALDLKSASSSEDEHDEESRLPEADRETFVRILASWSDTGLEEDVRLRASALSILSSCLTTPVALAYLKPSTARAAAELSLAVLSLETGAERAILRRAAVLVLLALVKGADGALENGCAGDVEVQVAEVPWAEVERVVTWKEEEDEDELVRGHIEVLREGLETWRVKRAFGMRAAEEGGVIEMEGIRLGGGIARFNGKEIQGLSIGLGEDNSSITSREMLVEEVEE